MFHYQNRYTCIKYPYTIFKHLYWNILLHIQTAAIQYPPPFDYGQSRTPCINLLNHQVCYYFVTNLLCFAPSLSSNICICSYNDYPSVISNNCIYVHVPSFSASFTLSSLNRMISIAWLIQATWDLVLLDVAYYSNGQFICHPYHNLSMQSISVHDFRTFSYN